MWFAAVYRSAARSGDRPFFVVEESRDGGKLWQPLPMRRCLLSSLEAWVFAEWPPCEFLAIGFDEAREELWIEFENDIAVDGRGIVWRATRRVSASIACWRIVKTEKDAPGSTDGAPLRF